ncbi:hypothetical protein Tco_1360923 [Tanacetum coccineum]
MSKNKSEKGLVAKSFDWDEESLSSKYEGLTMVIAFMAIAKDEPAVGKADARSLKRNHQSRLLRKRLRPKSPAVLDPSPDKKSDSSTEQFLLTLMKEVKGLKDQIKPSSDNSLSVSQTWSSKYHLGKLDEKADDGFFLGYSPVAKALGVFNIRRQEIKETYHSMKLMKNPSLCIGNDDHLPYVPAFDPLSTNNIISDPDTEDAHCTRNINSPDESPKFSIADDHPAQNELDDSKPTEN